MIRLLIAGLLVVLSVGFIGAGAIVIGLPFYFILII